jgi:hypothetical protein
LWETGDHSLLDYALSSRGNFGSDSLDPAGEDAATLNDVFPRLTNFTADVGFMA